MNSAGLQIALQIKQEETNLHPLQVYLQLKNEITKCPWGDMRGI